MNKSLLIIASLAATAAVAFSQEPRFEAASVKPNTSGGRGGFQTTGGRTYMGTNVAARGLILRAYELMLDNGRLVGGPEWLMSARYDIVATLPENSTPRQIPAMLRSLLADRFKLIVHTEVREAPAYALVLARNDKRLGSQLRKAPVDCGLASDPGFTMPASQPGEPPPCELEIGGEIRGRGQRMEVLARMLIQFVGRTIVDKTGLTGGFDFDIQFAEAAAGGGDGRGADLPSVFTALQEQLGLKLESIREPLEFIVIDSIEQPDPN